MSETENPPKEDDGDKNPQGGSPGSSPEKCEPLRGTTDADTIAISLLWEAAAAAAAAAQSLMAAHVAAKQYEIAKIMLNLAKFWRDWYNAGFVPLENKELDELDRLEKPEPHPDVAMGRGAAAARAAFGSVLDRTLDCVSEYSTGLAHRIVRETLVAEGMAVAHGKAAGYRFDRDQTDKLYDVYWRKFLGAAMRGRDMSYLAINYGVLANNVYGSLGAAAADNAAGLMEFVGYKMHVRGARVPYGHGAGGGISQVVEQAYKLDYKN